MTNKYFHFYEIYKLKTNSILKRIASFFYLRFTRYTFAENNHVSNKFLIFYTHEKVFRKDYHSFLMNLHNSLNDSSIMILKRRLSLKNIFSFNNPIISDLDHFYKKIGNYQKIILFYPHSLSGCWIQENFSSKNIISLQHGYYQYPKKEFNIYSKATRSDYAIIYNKDYLDFFSFCKKILIQKDYLLKNKNEITVIDCDASIFYSIITETNIDLNRNVLNFIIPQNKNITIYHHPHTSFLIKIKLHFFIKNKFNISPSYKRKKFLSKNNYFINTTIWKDYVFNNFVSVNIFNLKLGKFEKVFCKNLYENENKNFMKMINKIKLWGDSSV